MQTGFSLSDPLALTAIVAAAILAHWGKQLSIVVIVIAAALSALALLLAWKGAETALAAGYGPLGNGIAMAGGVLAMAPSMLLRSRKSVLPSLAPAPNLQSGLEVTSPYPQQAVPWQFCVVGRRSDPNQKIQVLLFSAGKWWVQDQPRYEGLSWRATCRFGYENEHFNEPYEVVALADYTHITGHIDSLPRGFVHSKAVTVYRESKPDSLRLIGNTPESIDIVYPLDQQKVQRDFIVVGHRATLAQEIHVLIQAGGTWWSQVQPTYEGLKWHAQCVCGRPSDHGQFQIIAVADLGMTIKSTVNLPASAVKSKPITVVRQR